MSAREWLDLVGNVCVLIGFPMWAAYTFDLRRRVKALEESMPLPDMHWAPDIDGDGDEP